MLLNPWVWDSAAQEKYPDRVTGESVPLEYLNEGYSEYYPYTSWITKGYVKRIELKEYATELL
ncbi:hypothetical protein AF332_11490 [Sporosarcina globispora]|uniref:Uncharacterized protein n=1 Tax=Sporosarcina globispora TaxID=1459 RepID=A0A0M0GCX4_SPOGL|nr:hypothetical protein AF332_11490 [Sporosarcina globispora]